MPYLMDGELSLTTNLDGEIGVIEQTPPTVFILHLYYDEETGQPMPVEPFSEVWAAHKSGLEVYVDCNGLYPDGQNLDETCAYIGFSDDFYDLPEYYVTLQWYFQYIVYRQYINVSIHHTQVEDPIEYSRRN